jgi:hypothetical protein
LTFSPSDLASIILFFNNVLFSSIGIFSADLSVNHSKLAKRGEKEIERDCVIAERGGEKM